MSDISMIDLETRKLPSQLLYSNVRPLGLLSKASTRKLLPLAGNVYQVNNPCNFIIGSSTAFLDPSLTVLKFRIRNETPYNANQAAGDCYIDGSASSLIDSIRITSNSSGTELEYINQYGFLHNMLANSRHNPAFKASKAGAVQGFATDETHDVKILGPADANNVYITSEFFYVPLLSGIIGSMSSGKFLPLFLTGDLSVSITFTNAGVVKNRNISIIDPQLCITECTFLDQTNEKLKQLVMEQGIYFSQSQFKSVSSAQASAGGATTLQITERFKSVESVLVGFKPVGQGVAVKQMSSIQNGITFAQLRAGDLQCPMNGATDVSEMYFETMKSLGLWGLADYTGGSITDANYIINADIAALTAPGKFFMGFDTSAINNSYCECGLNTLLNNPVYVELRATTHAVQICAYYCYSSIMSLRPDGTLIISK
jgi:hypothetical protein